MSSKKETTSNRWYLAIGAISGLVLVSILVVAVLIKLRRHRHVHSHQIKQSKQKGLIHVETINGRRHIEKNTQRKYKGLIHTQATCNSPNTLCPSGQCLTPEELKTDTQNCGECGKICPKGQICLN